MLAKLFNNISVASLVRAVAFSIFILVGMALLSPHETYFFRFSIYHFSVNPLVFQMVLALIVLLCAWWLNSSINSLGFLKNDYQLLPVFTLLVTSISFISNSLELILILPLGLLLVLRLLSISHTAADSYALFDVGTIIGVMFLLVPETLLFLPVSWIAIWSFGRVYFRALLMPVVGMAAIWFMGYTVVFWLTSVSAGDLLSGIFSQIEVGFHPDGYSKTWWRFIPLVIVTAAAIVEMFQVYGKASVYKRQCFTFLLYFFLLFLIIGAFIPFHSRIWIWLSIPLAVLIVNLIHYLRKQWMKDIIYVLLIINLLLLFFF